jgi:Zn-dependent peptidase ImmA (M78 family)/transcriptional regulator with XRE-family HTH domain
MIGQRIRQARLLADFTQEELAAALTKAGHPATKAVISKYEKNKSTPPARLLMLASRILQIPTGYFVYHPKVNVRWLESGRRITLLEHELQKVRFYANDITDLQLELQSMLYPDFRVNLPQVMPVKTMEEAEEAAGALRACWHLGHHPIGSLIQTAEGQGIIVIGWTKHSGDFDGLSGWANERYPVMVINVAIDNDRRRFTLARKLGRLVMNTKGLSPQATMRLLKRFAAAMIVPAECAFHELGTKRTRVDLEELVILKRQYGLSVTGWIHRALELDIIADIQAKRLWQELDQRRWELPEPVAYVGDELPFQLDQMAYRAVAERLISPNRVRTVYLNWREREADFHVPTMDFSFEDLLDDALPESELERRKLYEEAFKLASWDDMESVSQNQVVQYDERSFR